MKNYANITVEAVALVTSFVSNSSRSKGDGGGGNKDVDKLEAIVTIYLATDCDNDSSNDKYFDDDDDEFVESIDSVDDHTARRTDDVDGSIADTSIIINEFDSDNNDNYNIAKGNNNNDNDDKDDKNDNYSKRCCPVIACQCSE